jgi:hypothetical protein
MKALKPILFFFIAISIISCKKTVDDSNRPEFIGHWYCAGSIDYSYSIRIESNSNAFYSENSMGLSGGGSFDGKARIGNDKLKIGRFHHFDIVEYPHKIDTSIEHFLMTDSDGQRKLANWKMTLRGPKLYMGSGDYYKIDY